MILISHRGNLIGKNESLENNPNYIDVAISKGYDVEIDVWFKDDTLWLGHDKPQYTVTIDFFKERISKLWIHCKNIDAVQFFMGCKDIGSHYHYFWHQNDDITLTSFNYIWAYPGKQPIKGSIAVMPEINNDKTTQCAGICSDYIDNIKSTIQ